MYYKIVEKATNKVLELVQELTYVRFLSHGRVYPTDKQTAEGLAGANYTIYSLIPNPSRDVPIVSVYKITEEEFTRLQGLVNSDGSIIDPESFADMIEQKIKEMSVICKERITAGFRTVLTDNKYYHFELTAEDQLNLMQLEVLLNSGASSFVYHAKNMPCCVFSREDVAKILSAYRLHTLYHTTYFNAAKQYLRSATTAEQISSFTYGTDVTAVIQDKTIRTILASGGVS